MRNRPIFYNMEWLPDTSDSEKTYFQQKPDAKLLRNLMKEVLTTRQNEIIVLYYYENLTHKQIAQRLGIAECTVSRTKKRARQRLARYLYYYNIQKGRSSK